MNRTPPFKQQLNITTLNGSSIVYGFGNIPRSKFSLQVTGNDGAGVAAQGPNFLNGGTVFGAQVAPTSWDVVLRGITDLNNGTGGYYGVGDSNLCEHGSNVPIPNGEVVSNEGPPIFSVIVIWSNVVLGTANNLLVTITADE